MTRAPRAERIALARTDSKTLSRKRLAAWCDSAPNRQLRAGPALRRSQALALTWTRRDHRRVHSTSWAAAPQEARVAAITAQAMRGEIDYTESCAAASRCSRARGIRARPRLRRAASTHSRRPRGCWRACSPPRAAAAGLGLFTLLHRAAQGRLDIRLHGFHVLASSAPLDGRVSATSSKPKPRPATVRSRRKSEAARSRRRHRRRRERLR